MQNANAENRNTRQTKLPPALNPEQAALTQPWRDFVSRGFLTSIEVKFTGNSTSVGFTVGPQVKTPEGAARENIPAGMAKQYIIDSGLWSSKDGKKPGKKEEKVQLPKKSLVKRDFEKEHTDDEAFKARVAAVAAAVTDTAARGRIGSLRLMRKGVDNFEKWWKLATPIEQTRLLMDGKHHSELGMADRLRFTQLVPKCPFRGSVPTPSEEEDEAPEAAVNGSQAGPSSRSPPRPASK